MLLDSCLISRNKNRYCEILRQGINISPAPRSEVNLRLNVTFLMLCLVSNELNHANKSYIFQDLDVFNATACWAINACSVCLRELKDSLVVVTGFRGLFNPFTLNPKRLALCICICVKFTVQTKRWVLIDRFDALTSCFEHSCSLIPSCADHSQRVEHG